MKVEYYSHYGSDAMVVDAARCSFDKLADMYPPEKNDRLIHYLAEHGHWLPFAHPHITLRLYAPIFVLRQLGKHQVGFVWSEVSRRYIDSEPEFYHPKGAWRLKSENKKQGSSEECHKEAQMADYQYENLCDHAIGLYNSFIKEGICPELARTILPQSMYTTVMWTGSLYGYARVLKQRLDQHTQKETAIIANQIKNILLPLFPISLEALLSNG